MESDEFTRLYAETIRPVSRLVARYVRGSSVADVVQTAYVKAWCARESFRGESSFSSWVCGIALRAAIDHVRRSRRHESYEDVEVVSQDSCVGDGELVERVFAYAREQFGSDELARDWYFGLTQAESARRRDLTLRQVDFHRHSLRQKLARYAKAWGVRE